MPTELTRRRIKSILTVTLLVVLYLVYTNSSIRDQFTFEHTSELTSNPWTALLIVVAMTGAWTLALPASIFFFITPLLFPIVPSTIIVCTGSVLGTAAGYIAARYVGGPWVAKFRDHRVTTFLRRHSSFASLFAVRVFPSSPHGFLNYGAGLVRIPFLKFVAATMCGVALKAILYATAIQGSVGVASMTDALNWQTVTALFLIGSLAITGHILQRRWVAREEFL